MKKMLIAMLAVPFIALCACGGGGAGEGTGGGGGIATGAPTIETVGGTGADGALLDTLVVTGTNFDDTMEVYLVSAAETVALTYAVESNVKFSAVLPTDIVQGDFNLEVQNDLGKATAPLSLLQGEPGPQGPQGPAGDSGISVIHNYSCPGSGDLDVTADNQAGSYATIYEFSDGSMFISCESSILYSATLFWDYSTAVAFVPSNLVSSMGYIACIPMYVNGRYVPDANGIRWSFNEDPSVFVDVACSTVY